MSGVAEVPPSQERVLAERFPGQARPSVEAIAYLVSQYPTFNHTFVLREIRRLRDLGMDVRVLSISDPDRPIESLPPMEADEASATFYVKSSGVGRVLWAQLRLCVRHPLRYSRTLLRAFTLGAKRPGALASHLLYFAEAVVVADWLARHGIGRLHAHFSSTVALFASWLAPVRFSFTVHGPAEFDDVEGFHLREKVSAAWRVVAISRFARSQVLRVAAPGDWEKVVVVPLGVDPALYARRPAAHEARDLRLLTVGRLHPVKGQSVLLEAVAAMRREGREVTLRIVGDGTERRRLEACAAALSLGEAVQFEGWQPQERVSQLLGAVDVFVLSSFAEGVPVVLMEAMASGVACVASGINGIPELIRDGIDGVLVPPADVAALAAALIKLQDDPALRARLALSGVCRVESAYDLHRNVRLLADVLNERVA